MALNICLSELLNCSKRDCAIVGPIPGKPSRMNCFFCCSVKAVFVSLKDVFLFSLVWRLAIWIRKFTVSFSFSV